MITKGIVEDVIDKYTIKVRCPIYDKVAEDSLYNGELNNSHICTITGGELNLNSGDIVFVGFEDGDFTNPVILGYLGIESKSNADIKSMSLIVENSLSLPKNTSIGDITDSNIECLSGLSSNLKGQLDNIEDKYQKNSDTSKDYLDSTNKQKDLLEEYSSILDSYITLNNSFSDLIGKKDDLNKDTVYGKINYINNQIDLLNKSIGNIPNGTTISNEINDLMSIYNNLTQGIVETSPSLDTEYNYMLGRAEKMINVSWEAKTTFSMWNSSKNFIKGTTYYGMPYTLFGYGYTYDAWKKNSDRNMSITQYASGYGERTGPKYGSCCADFVSEVFGLPVHTRNCSGLLNNKYLIRLENDDAKISNIKPGDALVSSSRGHVVWVGKKYDDKLVIYEQAPPLAKKSTTPLSSNKNGFLYHGNSTYTYILRPTQELLSLDINRGSDNSSNINNQWIYKGNKSYGKYSEQILTDSEYLNNGLCFWKLCKKAGWTAEAAAGAWSNAYAESKGNPWSYGTGGGGIFGFTPFDKGTTYASGIYDYANIVLHNAEKRWDGDTQVGYINWQIKNIIENGWTGIFSIRQPESRYWNYTPPLSTRIPKNNFNLDTYIKLNKQDYDATPTICAKLWLARYGVVDKTYSGRDLEKTINNHTKKAEELYQLFIKY